MYPILLLTLMASFLNAEYPTPITPPDAFMEQNIDYIKEKYQLPDEELQSPKVTQNRPKPRVSTHPKTDNLGEQKLHQLRQKLEITELKGKAKKIDAIRSELHINYPAPKHKSQLDKEVESVKKILHMDGEVEGEYSFANTVNDLKKTLQIESVSSWGIPTFGLGGLFTQKKKKKKKSFLSKINIFGDVQETGQSLYKGMKYSGQSAQMMSGMMYNSSKMYNGMFGMFDDSPFNIFEEEESSMFDFIESGNSIMELFD